MSLTNEDKQWIEQGRDEDRRWVEQGRDEDRRWFTEQLERVETSLLTAFHKWASPMEMRQRTHAAALRALDLELESLDDRAKKLEPGAIS
jgi:uncharacterized protein YPO0396